MGVYQLAPFARIAPIAFLLFLTFVLAPFTAPWTGIVYAEHPHDEGFVVAIAPSSVVIKVGERATINVTVTIGQYTLREPVCFGVEGFPSSGFRTSFHPECAVSQLGDVTTALIVEATPAAAPQTFTAFVTARSGVQTARAALNVTVEPAFPPWVAWAGLLLFFLLLGTAISGRPGHLIRRVRRLFASRTFILP